MERCYVPSANTWFCGRCTPSHLPLRRFSDALLRLQTWGFFYSHSISTPGYHTETKRDLRGKGCLILALIYEATSFRRKLRGFTTSNLTTSVAVLAEISPQSPQNLFIFIIKKYIYRIKLFNKLKKTSPLITCWNVSRKCYTSHVMCRPRSIF